MKASRWAAISWSQAESMTSKSSSRTSISSNESSQLDS